MKPAPGSLDFKTDPLENHYELDEELGRGNFAVVKKCRHKDSNEEFAAKCITKKRTKASKKGMSKDAIETEASILLSVDHEGVIKLYDVFETRQNITLVMELLTGGELFEEISKEEFILEKDACHYMKQILSAVGHLHENNIVHLDLKPENIVLKSKGQKEIKLVDFGLARKLQPGVELKEMMGTPEFAAPETISFDPVGFYTDMWALGVVAYILLSGASPFLGDDDQETYQNITSCEYDFDDEYFDKITENAKDFIRRLLVKQGSKRNTVDDCMKHPWLACEELETSVIDTKKMRAFVARRRWKQSLRMVTMISRLRVLARNSSPTSDTSGDESDSMTDTETGKDEKPLASRNVTQIESEAKAKPSNINIHDDLEAGKNGDTISVDTSGNNSVKNMQFSGDFSPIEAPTQLSPDSETQPESFDLQMHGGNHICDTESGDENSRSVAGSILDASQVNPGITDVANQISMAYSSQSNDLDGNIDNNNNDIDYDSTKETIKTNDYQKGENILEKVSKPTLYEYQSVNQNSKSLRNDINRKKSEDKPSSISVSPTKVSDESQKNFTKIKLGKQGTSNDNCPTFVLNRLSDCANSNSSITCQLEIESESDEEGEQFDQAISLQNEAVLEMKLQDCAQQQQQKQKISSQDLHENTGDANDVSVPPFTFKVTSLSTASIDHDISVSNSEKPDKAVNLTITPFEPTKDTTITASNSKGNTLQNKSTDSSNLVFGSENSNPEVRYTIPQEKTSDWAIDADVSSYSSENTSKNSAADMASGFEKPHEHAVTSDFPGNVNLVVKSQCCLRLSSGEGASVSHSSCSITCEKNMVIGNGTKVVVQLLKSNSIT